jgi:hypothetical protein
MKTINTNKTENEIEYLPETNQWLIRITILIFFMIINICFFSAQNQFRMPVRTGMGVDLYSSGNGHGIFYSPYVSLHKGRNTFTFGPTIQRTHMTLNGGRVSYSRNLSGNCETFVKDDYYRSTDVIQLNFFCYIQYNQAAYLNNATIDDEKMVSRGLDVDWNKVRYSTVESGTGIEFRININNHLCWKNYIGASVYQHLDYINGMDHEQCASSLTLGTGMRYKF